MLWRIIIIIIIERKDVGGVMSKDCKDTLQTLKMDDRVLKILFDADLHPVESLVRCHWNYKNGRIKVDLG